MKRGMLDIAADMLKSDLQGIKSFIQATHKGEVPFRKVKQSNEDAIAQFLSLDPQVKQEHAQQNPEAWSQYVQKIQELMGGMTNG